MKAFFLLPTSSIRQPSGYDSIGENMTAFFFLEMNPVNQIYLTWEGI
ncbi:hypothetical protein FBY51_1028 [Zymomonas mobilis]|nr:hypothetical protein ZZ6_1569 [Zymomonas mobilis subsp. mobilis ATCC 29191]TQK78808.1 hypothetical protein FBY53_1501 [Zymomonas mobilis]TQL15990.1 hypothetical protein FBY51_1028 [Zymomonas mobilis]